MQVVGVRNVSCPGIIAALRKFRAGHHARFDGNYRYLTRIIVLQKIRRRIENRTFVRKFKCGFRNFKPLDFAFAQIIIVRKTCDVTLGTEILPVKSICHHFPV